MTAKPASQLQNTLHQARCMHAHTDELSHRKSPRDNPHLGGWLALSMEDIEEARAALANHWSLRKRRFLLMLVMATPALIVAISALAAPSPLRLASTWFAVAIGSAVWAIWLTRYRYARIERVLEALQPANSDPQLCQRALEFVNRFGSVRAYRDVVINSGRELTLLDLRHLEKLGEEERAQELTAQVNAHHQKTCKQLHGLAT